MSFSSQSPSFGPSSPSTNFLSFQFPQINEAERDRISTQDYHLASSKAYEAAVRKTKSLEKDSKRAIAKSRPYFDLKAKFDQQLEEEKNRVIKLEENVVEAKKSYAESLRLLRAIKQSPDCP